MPKAVYVTRSMHTTVIKLLLVPLLASFDGKAAPILPHNDGAHWFIELLLCWVSSLILYIIVGITPLSASVSIPM